MIKSKFKQLLAALLSTIIFISAFPIQTLAAEWVGNDTYVDMLNDYVHDEPLKLNVGENLSGSGTGETTGYSFSVDESTFTVIPSQTNPDSKFSNKAQTGTLKIQKRSADNVLSGWKFRIKLTESPFEGYSYDETFTTDSNGLITVDNLRVGKYEVSEVTDGVVGYFTPDAQTIEITTDTVSTSEMTNIPYGSVHVTKIDKDYPDNKLAGATFTVYALDKTTVIGQLSEVTTGEYQLDRIPYGAYYLKETVAPANYQLDNTFYPFNIAEANSTVYVETKAGKGLENDAQTGTLKIQKRSADNVLAGWKFRVQLVNSTFKDYTYDKTFTTDANGLITIDNLRIGRYKVSEITDDVVGYFTADAKEIVIQKNTTSTVEMTNIPYGSVHVTKIDKDYPDNKLTGAKFTVYTSDKTTEIGKLVEITTGEYQLDRIPLGNYYLKETVAPENYVLDNTFYPFNITEAGSTVNVETKAGKGLENDAQTGTLKIQKRSADNVLAGWKFRVQLVESSFDNYTYDKTFTTDENGLITIDNLRIGKYRISEITNDVVGYFTPDAKEVTIKTNETSTAEMTNTPYGSVHVTKIDKDYPENKLTGAKFVVYALDKTTEIGSLTEIATGEYQLDNISYGNYYLKETVAPKNYVLDNTFYPFSITAAGVTVNVETKSGKGLENDAQAGTLKIQKLCADGVLAGWKFRVTLVDSMFDGYTFDKTFTTDDNGLITIENLRIGKYEVSEITDGIVGYFTPDSQVIEVKNDNITEIEMKNIPYGTITLTKVDSDNKDETITGTQYKVYRDVNENGTYEEDIDTEYKDLVDNNDGTYTLDEVPYGKYLVKEISAPDGYVVDNNYYPLFIDSADAVEVVSNSDDDNSFIEQPVRGTIEVTKIDADYPDVKLAGAEFTVYALDKTTVIGTLTEIEKGIYRLDGLRYGEYYLKETKAPEYFVLDDNYYYFQIVNNGETISIGNTGFGEGVFINSPQKGTLKIVKTSADGRVEGFSFLVTGTTYTGQNYEETFITDKNGIILIENLRAGEYTVHEVRDEASAGYILPADQTIIIKNDDISTLDIFNDLPDTPETGTFPALPLTIVGFGAGLATIAFALILALRKRK